MRLYYPTLLLALIFHPIHFSAHAQSDVEDALEDVADALDELIDDDDGDDGDYDEDDEEETVTRTTHARKKAPATSSTSVSLVTYDTNGSGFVQTGPKTWAEVSLTNKVQFSFNELSRDANCVRLHDDSRGMTIEINVKDRKIRFAKKGEKALKDLYNINGQIMGVNGFLANQIFVTNGSFQAKGGKIWYELDKAGNVKNKFYETDRTSDTIRLFDQGRDVFLQLDLARREVRYAKSDETPKKIYDIISAR